ncbi:Tic22 family protein [Marinobacter sp.]|uniref:Tic22 family protein n=1 Tax=Marinobacter sp. TaxID=50741 RepID=UPI003A8E79E3
MKPSGLMGFYTMKMCQSILVGLCFLMAVAANAQPADKEAVINALNAVPVYYVTTASGAALAVGAQQQADFVPVFLYPEEANIAKAELERDGATALKVVRAELGVLYSGELSKNTNGASYALVANPTQRAAAQRISNGKSFSEVPVFIAKHKESGEVMTMKQSDGTLAVPLFLEFHRIEAALDALGKQVPDVAGAFKVEAYPLSAIVNDMQTGALNPANVVMIPPVN